MEQQSFHAIKGSLKIEPQNVINKSIIGGGVNFSFSDYVYFDYINGGGFSQNLPYSEDPKLEDKMWEEFLHLIDICGMQYIRLQVSYTQWEPINDNDDPFNTDFDKGFIFSPHFRERPEAKLVPENTYRYMEHMYRLLEHFEKRGLFVILGNWSGGQSAPGFCPENKNWLATDEKMDRKGLHIKSVEEFAESFAAIMYHLIVEKGFTCVKGFSIYNEPEHFIDFEKSLIEVYIACDAHLRRLGIRDKVMIQAFDSPIFWTAERDMNTDSLDIILENCGSCMDILSIHHYVSTIEAGPVTNRMQGTIQSRLIKDFVAPAVAKAGERPVVIGELGTFAYTQPTGSVEQGDKNFMLPIFNAEAATALYNAGAKGYGLWVYNTIIHPYFTMLDLSDDKPKRLIPDKINFFPSALAMKYLAKGTDIVKSVITDCELNSAQRVFAVAGVKGNNMTILLVNDSEEAAEIQISGIDSEIIFNRYSVTSERSDRILNEGKFELDRAIQLEPLSITVFTTYNESEVD